MSMSSAASTSAQAPAPAPAPTTDPTPTLHSVLNGTLTHLPTKTLFTGQNPFETKFGYHRAVRRGSLIFVSGTTALAETGTGTGTGTVTDGQQRQQQPKVLYVGDAHRQALVSMQRCVDAVTKLGGRRGDVVRVRMYVARHDDCAVVGEAFRVCFGHRAPPASGGHGDGNENENENGLEVGEEEEEEEEVGAVATMVVVQNGFVDADILVEVEVDAVVVEQDSKKR